MKLQHICRLEIRWFSLKYQCGLIPISIPILVWLECRVNCYLLLTVGFVFADGDLLGFADFHGEQQHLGRHWGHLVTETVTVDAVAMRGERVFAVGLSWTRVNDLVVGTDDLDRRAFSFYSILIKTINFFT